jgi:hypothetical protein
MGHQSIIWSDAMIPRVRTTVTLDPDTEQIVRRLMAEQGIGFKQALNEAIRNGVRSEAKREPFRTQTAAMGRSAVNLDGALSVAADLEDEELLRRMRLGS